MPANERLGIPTILCERKLHLRLRVESRFLLVETALTLGNLALAAFQGHRSLRGGRWARSRRGRGPR